MKQDRVAPRTVPDLERKYNFGDRFSEILGLIDDTRKDVDSTSSELRDEITEQSTAISRNTEQIVMEAKKTTERFDSTTGEISSLRTEVESKVTADAITFAIKTALENGVDSVHTKTGYTFNDEGLTISKTGTEMSTQITDDGMQVFRANDAVLIANHKGVDAVNLEASTYLTVGGRSRFENYGTNRTGCFWVGG